MPTQEDPGTVLVVEDEKPVASLYEEWLTPRYEVLVATSGEQALDLYDGRIDVVLLDRRLPGISGDGVVAGVRRSPHDCRIAMVTAVEPDVDIVDLGIDEYLVKPVDSEDLRELIERLRRRATYDDLLGELYALASKKGALEAHNSRQSLQTSPEYAELRERLDELHDRIEATTAEFDDEDFVGLLREADATVP